MSPITLWLLFVVLPNIAIVLGIVFFCLTIATIITWIIFCDDKNKRIIPKYMTVALAVVVILSIPFPSEKQIYFMTGAYLITNTKDIEKLPPNLVKSINKFLEDYQGEQK